MSKVFIPDGQSSKYEISGNYGDYELAFGSSLTLTPMSGSDAIAIDNNAYGNRVAINGTIQTGSGSGIYDGGNGTRFSVGVDGQISAGHSGIYFSGDGGMVTNKGTITGDYALNVGGNGVSAVNSGNLDGDVSGITANRAMRVVNKAGGDIHGDDYGISLGYSGGHNVVRNFGSITSESQAIRGTEGVDRIVNHGHIEGMVTLDKDDDVFDGRGGTFDGTVSGGIGNDTFMLGDKHTQISEFSGGGFDTMKAGFSFTLADNVEQGSLTGSKNLKLSGTANGDLLFGNNGDNVIHGGAGSDFINGGRGDDRLFGAGASPDATSDIFIFKAHTGDDVVADFEDGVDYMSLAGYSGIHDFADLKGHIHEVGNDCVVTLLHGDSITIEDTAKSAIKGEDFLFLNV